MQGFNCFKIGRKFNCVISGLEVIMQENDRIEFNDDGDDIRLFREKITGKFNQNSTTKVYFLRNGKNECVFIDPEIEGIKNTDIESDENDFKGFPNHLNCRWSVFCSYTQIRARKRKNSYKNKNNKKFLLQPFSELKFL